MCGGAQRAARPVIGSGVRLRIADSNATDILDKVAAGELDDEIATVIPPRALEDHIKRAGLKRYLHVDGSDSTTFLALNLTQPPFDDIHVRRALNWVMDKAALQRVWGGNTFGEIATHTDPPDVIGGLGVAGGDESGELSDVAIAEVAINALGDGFRHRRGWD